MGTHPIFESDFDCLTDMDVLPDLEVLQNKSALFFNKLPRGPTTNKKIRCPIGTETYRIIACVENDPDMSVKRVLIEYFPTDNILNSKKKPNTSIRVGLSKYETDNLLVQINSTLTKSKNLSSSVNNSSASILEKINYCPDVDDYSYETIIEPSYVGVPHHISVRSTKPPKIRVNPQRPNQTRKNRVFATERRQPEMCTVVNKNPVWKHGFHGNKLNYSKHLEEKHGDSINRYFSVPDPVIASTALERKIKADIKGNMDEYRKELRRQSEMIRADKPDYKWWEDT